MSLYEPSVRSNTWSIISRRLSRRFTTLEGWREVGLGVYAMSSNVRMFSLKYQFDPEHFRKEQVPQSAIEYAPSEPKVLPEEWIRTSQGTVGKAIGSITDAKCEGTGDSGAEGKEQPYHTYGRREKWTLVAIIGVAGLFPGLTENIYLPTLNVVASDFNTSLNNVSLTITSYYLAQAFGSLIWRPLADSLGRRSVYIYSFLLYISANIVLGFSPNFAILVVFRALQAVAIASTVSMGSVVIHDISLPAEQDSFYTFSQGIRNYTMVLAPIIGGLLSHFMNFRSIFVLLLGLSIAALVLILLFLPETHRSIAGNGTWPLRGIHQPLIWRFKVFGKPAHVEEQQLPGEAPRLTAREFVEPLALLKEKDIILSLLFSGVVFGIWNMVTVSTSGLFRSVFGLNDALLGLVFIPNGIGTIAGSTLMGNLLNRDFHTFSSTYKTLRSLPASTLIPRSSIPAYFPLEPARLVRLPMATAIFVISLSFYGFTLSYPQLTSRPGWILVPLLLQFVIALTASSLCAIHQTLIADLWPAGEASSAAISNLVRCVFAAAGVAGVQQFIRGVGVGPVFLALGLVVLIFVPLPIVQWCLGGYWRRERDSRGLNDMEGVDLPEKV